MGRWMAAPGKAAVRAWQVEAPAAGRALFLPGWDEEAGDGCACVREAMRTGLVGPRTQVLAVERDPVLAPRVAACLDELGLAGRVRMHGRELSRLRLGTGQPLDYAFVDLLGNLDAPTAAWMRDELAPALSEGATLAMTFAYGMRGNRFLARCADAFEGRHSGHARQAASHFGIHDRLALAGLLVTMSALRGLSFTFAGALHYRDGVRSMVAYRLDGIRRGGPASWPSLEEVAGDVIPHARASRLAGHPGAARRPPMGMTRVERLLRALDDVPATLAGRRPGHVAAADRAARELRGMVASYREGGHDRSAAALKAWATRRARGWVHPSRRGRAGA